MDSLCKNRSHGIDTPRWLQIKVYTFACTLYLNIAQAYLAGLLQISLLPCNIMLKDVNFTTRLQASSKDFHF